MTVGLDGIAAQTVASVMPGAHLRMAETSCGGAARMARNVPEARPLVPCTGGPCGDPIGSTHAQLPDPSVKRPSKVIS